MRRPRRASDASDESEYVASGRSVDMDSSEGSATDLTDADTCTDEEEGEGCEEDKLRRTDTDTNMDDMAWLAPCEEHTPDHYLRQLEAFDEEEYIRQDYKDSSTRLLNRMEDQWHQCWSYLKKPALSSFATVSIGTLHTFFDWLLDQRHGKGGRRRRGTKYASSLGTYWKVFRLVYERETSVKLEGKLNRSMHKVLRKLAKKHGLRKMGRDKACMYVEDQALVLRTNLVTTEKKYVYGRYRIQAQLYLQLGGFTANRPQALLGLCYRHIQVTLLRDPEGGPHRVLLEFTFEFTKEFLGIKDMNTFPLPEIMFDETLIFSPHVFLLGVLFHDQAFAAHNLTSPQQLSRLYIEPGRNELPLRLNKKLDDIPLFRKAVKTQDGWTMSPDEPLPYSTLLPWIKSLGQITGFAQVTRPYSLRYAGGKAFNENGNVSEAMQNLMMGHASISTFLKHYLSRRVTVDTQAVVRGTRPQESLMRAACTLSRSIDSRRPRRLTPQQSASVNDHPSIRTLLDQRKRFKRTHENPTRRLKYKDLGRRITQERQRQRHALLADIKTRWEYEQPVRDVEHQLDGVSIKDDSEADRDAMSLAQKQLVDSVMSPPGTTVDKEMLRRNTAITAVAQYCGIEEGGLRRSEPRKLSHSSTPLCKAEFSFQVNPDEVALEAAKVSVYNETRPRVCFACLGNEKLPVKERTYSFYTSGDLTKHFKRRHLANVKEEQIRCRLCRVDLDSKMHWQRHAHDVHGTVS